MQPFQIFSIDCILVPTLRKTPTYNVLLTKVHHEQKPSDARCPLFVWPLNVSLTETYFRITHITRPAALSTVFFKETVTYSLESQSNSSKATNCGQAKQPGWSM